MENIMDELDEDRIEFEAMDALGEAVQDLRAAQREYDRLCCNYEDAERHHEEAPSNYTLRCKRELRQALRAQNEVCQELTCQRENAWAQENGYFWRQQ